jgi:hypothetical protein
VWQSEPGYIGLNTYDVLNQRVVSHHFTFGSAKEAKLLRSPHRYIWPSELDLMGQLAGFELEARHADWAGAEFTAESRSHVSVYRLPATSSRYDRAVGDPHSETPISAHIHFLRVTNQQVSGDEPADSP